MPNIQDVLKGLTADICPESIKRFCEMMVSNLKFEACKDADGEFQPIERPDTRILNASGMQSLKQLWDMTADNEVHVIGRYLDMAVPNGVLIFAVKLTGQISSRSSKKKQADFAVSLIKGAKNAFVEANRSTWALGYSRAIFFFYDEAGNFRISLIESAANKPFRRQTFFVEHDTTGTKNRTFRYRMTNSSSNEKAARGVIEKWTSFKEISDAFSVKTLTKEFYQKLFAWYEWASGDPAISFPNNVDRDDDNQACKQEHLIRLITRLMFVWFIKQKKLVPNELFDKHALPGILKSFNHMKGDNYYRAILQNLFFATLNSEIKDRAFAVDGGTQQVNKEHFDIKTLYRYGKEFAIPEQEVLELFKSIPFLNGGLFECLDRGKVYADGFSREPKWCARIPNKFFFSEDESELGLIPLLQRYEFTVDENAAGDEEMALDPELLGKVFENLLGAYNPETKVAARNATGSFYTPREIVNYMVDESLKAHVLTKVGAGEDAHEGTKTRREEAVKQLFENGERPQDEGICQQIAEALETAKILDPACGSGAFPMGILLRMVELLRILRNIPDDNTEAIYNLKLHLIENCIYGDDIQPIAVQISKLRFFISLVVEQEPTADADNNFGIHTLPNLETKFVAADSLIPLEKPKERTHDGLAQADMFSEEADTEIKKLKAALWKVRHEHFRARSYSQKKELRAEDKKLRKQLAEELQRKKECTADSAKFMAAWDPYDQNTSATWSDPEWMFNVKDGFDIVIGNPPYIDSETMKKLFPELRDTLRQSLDCTRGNWDIYIAFFEIGFKRLKPCGILSYITPNKWLAIPYGKTLREYFAGNLFKLCDCKNIKVFEAGNSPIVSFINNKECPQIIVEYFEQDYSLIPQGSVKANLLTPQNWGLMLSPQIELVSKLAKMPCLVGDLSSVENPFTTSEAYELKEILNDAKGTGLLKLVNTGTIAKFCPLWGVKETTYLKDRYSYPSILPSAFENKMPKRRVQANNPKIIIKGIRYFDSFLDETGDFIGGKSTILILGKEKSAVNLLGLLGLLNSKLVFFYLKASYSAVGIDGGINFSKDMVANIPVPPSSEIDTLRESVAKIVAIKKVDFKTDTSALEAEIDRLVYQLYDLTPEEIAIVEGSVGREPDFDAPAPETAAGEEEETETPETVVATPVRKRKEKGTKARATRQGETEV